MNIWQVDFYRRSQQDESGSPLWELVVCDGTQTLQARCPQRQATAPWLTQQLQAIGPLPDRIQVFRPQSLSLLQTACQSLGITVEPTRHTPELKQWLQTHYGAIELDKPPPVPLPESLWGDRWRFGAIAAQDLLPAFQNRPIPMVELPESRFPLNLGLPSTLPIPGVIIDGGRQSMPLARWLGRSRPVSLHYLPGEPDGLILEAGLVDRWVLTTFDDAEVKAAGHLFRERQQAAQGLHFLLVQPDDSGMTMTGVWLLQTEP